MYITKEQAKKFLVIYHRLHNSNPITNDEGLLKYIKKVGCIQFDPINVLAYNSHLVFQSRYIGYQPEVLNDLLYKDFRLIDAWDKNLSIYHIEDDPYFERYRQRTHRYYSKLSDQIHEVVPSLKERMRIIGPTSSIDIKDSPQIDWAWAPTKAVRAALDYMFSNGEIYVHHKVNTRKYYDLIEHHPHIERSNDPFDGEETYFEWHIERRIGGVGLLPAYRDTYGFIAIDGLKAQIRRSTVNRLLLNGRIQEVHIEGVKDTYYIRTSDVDLLKKLDDYPDDMPSAKILAALDNLLWDRDMIEEIFNYRYRWEVYVPESKREYGYYVLPVLYGYDFIGRVIMKLNRGSNTLEIHNFYLESGMKAKQLDYEVMAGMFGAFARSLGADNVIVTKDAKNRVFIRKVISIINNQGHLS